MSPRKSSRPVRAALLVCLCLAPGWNVEAQVSTQAAPPVDRALAGLDQYMDGVLKTWNAPGVAIGIVSGDSLVFAKGYGYRDVATKLPMTPKTLVQVASNTKLFTAVGAGLLVEEGKLAWDEPIRRFVPSIRFSSDELDRSITLRDLLAHRTGITRHDTIWYRSDLTRADLFARLKYLEPAAPPRQSYLYNNLMYAAVGQIVEIVTGTRWEAFTRERLLEPLGMTSTVFTVDEMRASPDHGVPWRERRDSTELFQTPFYAEQEGIGPAGAIVSNVEDMSKWLIALMNGGRFQGRQVIPPRVLDATLAPAIAVPNGDLVTYGYRELLNPVYGTGRYTAAYRGHRVTYHGGAIGGFYSQVSFLPDSRLGLVVLVDCGHCAPLPDAITFNLYERLLGMDETPWIARRDDARLKAKASGRAARGRAGSDRVQGTKPSHAPAEFAGEYEHPAYGVLQVSLEGEQLKAGFRKAALPLHHYHYDRFDTPNDEVMGKFSINFLTNPVGEIDKAVMSLDEGEVTFTRRPDPVMRDPKALAPLAGTYQTETGVRFDIVLKGDGRLARVGATGAETILVPVRPWVFGVKAYSDVRYHFVVDGGVVKQLRIVEPAGESINERR